MAIAMNQDTLQALRGVRANEVPIFSLQGYVTMAKLVSNYDGDTANIIFPYHGTWMHMRARFYGYDTCEMKPSLKDPERDIKKKKAAAAKLRLWQLCTKSDSEPGSDHSTLILIQCGDFDKYGRLLVTAYPEGTHVETIEFDKSINAVMISEGHGYAYEGGRKSTSFGGAAQV
jgi:endonuclease YncB( thermonuclease family)